MKTLPANLQKILQKAYSAEKAAALAYQGHAASVQSTTQKIAIRSIEQDEWHHRDEVKKIMDQYGIEVSQLQELRYFLIGKIISFSCHIIGWFMPYFFAGKLESGNVCEYFRMMQLLYEQDICVHNQTLYDMGIREKEHEMYFLDQIREKRWLKLFERIFGWGTSHSRNDVELNKKYPIEKARFYCRKSSERIGTGEVLAGLKR